MKIVVDTNIVFSALISPKGNIREILMKSSSLNGFFAPYFMEYELIKYQAKMITLSGLSQQEFLEIKGLVMSKLSLINHDFISDEDWETAKRVCQDIDINDTPFVALAISLDAALWSGDKKLIKGLKSKNIKWAKSTDEIAELL